MRTAFALALPVALLAALPRLDAQANRIYAPSSSASIGSRPVGHGFGNVVFPATGIPGGTHHTASHAHRLGATISGYPVPGTGGGIPGRRFGGYVPYAVPVFVGGGYGYGYGYGPEPQPNITVVNAPPTTPGVVINNNYAPPEPSRPAMRDYGNQPLPEHGGASAMKSYQAPIPEHDDPPAPAARAAKADKPTVYLIALRDGSVFSAYAYWVEKEVLHYITTKHSHNQASLSLVDETLTTQLNRERSVDFSLNR